MSASPLISNGENSGALPGDTRHNDGDDADASVTATLCATKNDPSRSAMKKRWFVFLPANWASAVKLVNGSKIICFRRRRVNDLANLSLLPLLRTRTAVIGTCSGVSTRVYKDIGILFIDITTSTTNCNTTTTAGSISGSIIISSSITHLHLFTPASAL
jgi:hypothetical protein